MDHLIWRKLGVVALLLALPFVVHVGASGRTVVNGEVVSEYNVNYLGILLAVVGLAMAVGIVLRRSLSQRLDAPPTPAWVRAVAALLAVLGVAQAAIQADFLKI